jgi:Mg-chelatase subunit ChlD
VPLPQPLDIVLVLDTSTSMSDRTQPGGPTKLEAAVSAADMFVDLLRKEDWLSLVAFDATAAVEQPLTGDRAAFRSALASLVQHEGTQIDDGLIAAQAALEETRTGARPVVILLTDGRHAGTADEVLVAATQLKRSGATLITIGLGQDVDHDLLRSAASSSGLYYPAPDANDLSSIYAEISALLPCAP